MTDRHVSKATIQYAVLCVGVLLGATLGVGGALSVFSDASLLPTVVLSGAAAYVGWMVAVGSWIKFEDKIPEEGISV